MVIPPFLSGVKNGVLP